jgi:hypothetical protein
LGLSAIVGVRAVLKTSGNGGGSDLVGLGVAARVGIVVYS